MVGGMPQYLLLTDEVTDEVTDPIGSQQEEDVLTAIKNN